MHKYRSDAPLDVLVRLFLLGATVPAETMRAVFDDRQIDSLAHQGLLNPKSSEGWQSAVRLVPIEDCIVACDFGGRAAGVERVYSPGSDSVWLAKAIARRPVARALDLCTGSGLQAVVAARQARSVVAVDLNPRAVRLAGISLALNGIGHAVVSLGDLYDAVGAATFDLVTANPPFVINHVKSHLFRDGGAHGDDVLRRVLDGLPSRLTPGGVAQIVTFLHEFDGRSQLDEIRTFSEAHGFEALVFTSERQDKYQLATSQMQSGIVDFDAYQAGVRAYLEHLEAVRFTSYVTAVISLRKGGGPAFKVIPGLHRPARFDTDLQGHLRRFFRWD